MNHVDCAIATPVDPAKGQVTWNTSEVGAETPVTSRQLGDEDLGLAVEKSGRSTEHTEGFVQSLFATVQVKYDLLRKATFTDQIIVSSPAEAPSFSSGGDSGSLVYDAKDACIGLLFAGSESSGNEPGTTIINPINHVLRELNVEFLTPNSFPSAAGRKRRVREKKGGRTRGPGRPWPEPWSARSAGGGPCGRPRRRPAGA